jgi:hypothetical protein
MKLPRLWGKPTPKPADPARAEPSAPALKVLISSSTGLPGQEFSVQLHPGRLDRGAEVLAALFEAARLHGTTVEVRAWPAGDDSSPGQAS